MNMWNEAEKFLIEMNVGDFYESGGERIEVIQRTKSKIKLSNDINIMIKSRDGYKYLNGKNNGKKSGGVHKQIIRDIEGYLIYKKLTQMP
jgi:hypothetical protein